MSTSSSSNTNGMEKTQQTLLLTEMRKLIAKQGSSAEHYGDPMLMRFLIASSMDPTKAAKMLIKWKKWREEIAPLGYIPQSEILDQLEAKKLYLQGLSTSGHSVFIVKINKHFAPKDQLQTKKGLVHAFDKAIARSFSMDVPSDCSWSWRGILNMRDRCKPFTRHMLANGLDTNFWHSPWSDKGILHQHVPSATKYLTGIRESATVSCFIQAKQWRPAPNNNPLVNELWKSVTGAIIDTHEEKDVVVWTPSPNGNFSIKTAYATFRRRYTKVEWAKAVWSPIMIPKHSFITWLAARERLATQDKLVKWGTLEKSICSLCTDNQLMSTLKTSSSSYGLINYFKVPWINNSLPPICNRDHYSQIANSGVVGQNSSICIPQETHWHLWFDCKFSKLVWKKILTWCGYDRSPVDAVAEWTWIATTLKGGTLNEDLARLAFCATIYELWRERNNRIFSQKFSNETRIIQQIKNEVRMRFEGLKMRATDTPANRAALGKINAKVQLVTKPLRYYKWEPPDRDYTLLNSDGSMKEDGSTSAGLLRNYKGEVLMTYCEGSRGKTAGYVELQAILTGMDLCLNMGLLKVQVGADSKEAIECIKGNTKPTWRTRHLVSSIRMKTRSFEDIRWKHIYRETNAAADWLSKLNCYNDVCNFAMNPLPKELNVIVAKDREGFLYQRL